MSRKKCHQSIIREELEQKENNEQLNDWLKDVNLSPSNAEVRIITNKEAKEIISKYEWLGTMPAGAFLSVGLFFDGHLAGVEVFTETKSGGKYTLFNKPTICLARGCCVYWCPKWGSSYLITRTLKLLTEYYKGEPRYIIAYSDWEAGEIGTVYQASNWYYLGHQNYYFWIDINGKKYDKCHHRDIAKKKDKEFNNNKKINMDIVLEVKQQLLNNGWKYREKLIRGRYVTVIGYNSPLKRQMIKLLKENQKPYPKEHKLV